MIPTLKLSDIITVWRDALQASQPIRDFCTAHYNKQPNIFVGINGKTPPAATDGPVIILYPGTKSEGLELQEYTYKLTISWMISQPAVVVTGNLTEYSGVAECDSLGQLIYLELAQLKPDNPISVLHYNIEPVAYFPQFCGRMDITVTITPVNGYSINF
ncbi:hypothetical protein M7775_12880 [Sporomusa sphaeroides DSM 2875]|uniref:hypothetical protein n=1 Tax=Sporomusa sphaeroides TaxID=47679 RepID=UPI00202E1D49|nr:hypothetical protein [Sporomusa sphaeroides]MCM0759455.1 hypothetical protein [Sporomusa sphaeroides DSM 2875]